MPRRPKTVRKNPGHPIIPIDWDELDPYLEAGCTGVEIAGYIGCSANTIYDRCLEEKGICFSQYAAQKRSRGDARIRQKQYFKAVNGKGDNTMLLWLGKQRLGQSEDPQKTDMDRRIFGSLIGDQIDKLKENFSEYSTFSQTEEKPKGI